MSAEAAPRVIVVYLPLPEESKFYADTLRETGSLVYECKLPDVPSPSFVDRVLRRNSPFAPMVKAAYDFVVGNHWSGDSVLILDTIWGHPVKINPLGQSNRHTVIRQLAAALHTGVLQKSKHSLVREKIPIKCLYLHFSQEDGLGWPGADRELSDLPPTVESFLCFNRHLQNGYDAYAIERGSYGRIIRKECWHNPQNNLGAYAWVMLQISHIIPNDPADWGNGNFELKKLLSTATYLNCTKRRGGLPSNDAIPTGGQLIRVAYVASSFFSSHNHLVWSSQSFAEGKYDDVCSTPAFGPKRLR